MCTITIAAAVPTLSKRLNYRHVMAAKPRQYWAWVSHQPSEHLIYLPQHKRTKVVHCVISPDGMPAFAPK